MAPFTVTAPPTTTTTTTSTTTTTTPTSPPPGETTTTTTIAPEPGDSPRPPIAGDDEASTTVGLPVVIPVLDNVSDPDGDLDPGTLRIVVAPDREEAEVLSDGTVRYTPEPEFIGIDQFVYEVCDLESDKNPRLVVHYVGS